MLGALRKKRQEGEEQLDVQSALAIAHCDHEIIMYRLARHVDRYRLDTGVAIAYLSQNASAFAHVNSHCCLTLTVADFLSVARHNCKKPASDEGATDWSSTGTWDDYPSSSLGTMKEVSITFMPSGRLLFASKDGSNATFTDALSSMWEFVIPYLHPYRLSYLEPASVPGGLEFVAKTVNRPNMKLEGIGKEREKADKMSYNNGVRPPLAGTKRSLPYD
eukprot:Platyproteum_vivax@DN6162_c0_g2_i1.p1